MATGTSSSAESHETDSGRLTQQPLTHLENIVTSGHGRAHFGHYYHGPVSYTTNTTNIPPAASTAPVEHPRLLPRAPNRQYVGYAHVLDRLKSCFLQQDGADHEHGQITCVLSGMGGVGKSETVLQFLDKNDTALRERFWGVFWVDCESEASARTDFERIANTCGWSLSGENVISGVKDQLASSRNQALLILDNCDEMKTDYNRYIPHGTQVNVILTTRLSDARTYASVDPGDSKSKLFLQLNGLAADPAIDLLLEASEIQERDQQSFDHAKQIVTALDHHPLAITVASSLVRSSVYSLEEYVDALQNQLAQKELLETDSVQARYRKVSTTFEVSAECLQSSASTNPSAKAALALLDILGFMHHQYVSEEIFVRAWEYEKVVLCDYKDPDSESDADSDYEHDITHLSTWHVARCRSIFSSLPLPERKQLFRKARAQLSRLSLVSVDRTQKCMSLHLVVHSWARDRVKCTSETWSAVAATLALSAKGSFDWKPYNPQLVPHYEKSFGIWKEMGLMHSDQWEICRIWYIYAYRMYWDHSIATMKICLQLLQQIEELCRDRPEQLALAEAIHLLGLAYGMDGQTIKAIKALEHAAKSFEKLAEDHPDRLISQHELAHGYLANGQVTEAVDMLEHVVKVRDQKLAEHHPDRLVSQHELARVYLANGQVTEAIDMLEHVVKVRDQKLAEHHPGRLNSQHELARAYLEHGQITEAIDLIEHVVEVRDEKLAEDHPDRLTSQHTLARAYLEHGQITEAIDMLEHVVEIRDEKLAEDHPARLSSQHELARAYWSNDQITEALEHLRPVVASKQSKYEAGHPSRTISKEMLADILKEEEELALERRSPLNFSSSPQESGREIGNVDEALAADPADSVSREEDMYRSEQHPIPVSCVPPSEPTPEIKPRKRERLKMAFRLR